MPLNQLILLFGIQLGILLLPSFGISKMFKKAGQKEWKAWIPFYNTWIMLKLLERKQWPAFVQLIPILGWFISMSIFVEFAKGFGKFAFHEHAFAALLPVVYFPWLGLNPKDRFIGQIGIKKHKKSSRREWVDAAIFAVVAATLIRTFVFEAYAIPTASMEKTMLVNDYLFVSKMAYGPRLPNTPLSIPFIHNTIPFTNTKSYLEWIEIPYTRWFPSPIKRNDIVVFNMPEADSTINKEDYGSKILYYDVLRYEGKNDMDRGRQLVMDNPDEYPIIVRPVDKEDNYVKRCVAVPGDILEIKDQILFINGEAAHFPPKSQNYYSVETGGQPLDESVMEEEYDVDISNADEFQTTPKTNVYRMLLTQDAKEKMIKSGLAKSILPEIIMDGAPGQVYPFDKIHAWTLDEFGPIWIPKKGVTMKLTEENYPVYERLIRTYERNRLEKVEGRFFINGKLSSSYTFKMDYYWMMGDNRHNSQDARHWGFVPEDHIVGKPAFVFMSVGDHGIRWSRLFKGIR